MEYNGGKNSYKSQDTSPLSKTASRPKKYDVFLSHHRSDKEQVEIIAARLKDEVGLNPFLDKWRLEPGESWNEEIETALNNSAACAVFVGPHGPAPWQNEQMRSALHERIDNHTLRVIPVLLERAGPLEEDLLPQFLQPLSWVDFRSGLESQEAFSHLVAGIRGKKYLGLTQSAFHKLLEWFNDEIDDQDSGGRKIHLIGKRGRSPMEKQAYNEELIVQYLLGSLPEEETERFDELCFVDDEFAERLSAVENDLVDTYVRGELSSRNLKRFDSHYLASPRRREKIRIARAFQIHS